MASHMKSYAKLGETLHGKLEKVNSDILALTYGSLVTQLLKDGGDIEKVNTQLEQIGVRMGMRLVEEFLALSGIGTCKDFTETMEVLSKTAFKMFLGVTADVGDWDETKTKCTISFLDNPLLDFVELPAEMEKLDYSQVICGIIRGALEQLLISVSCHFIKDVLRGDAINEIRVELHSIRKEEFKDKYLSKNDDHTDVGELFKKIYQNKATVWRRELFENVNGSIRTAEQFLDLQKESAMDSWMQHTYERVSRWTLFLRILTFCLTILFTIVALFADTDYESLDDKHVTRMTYHPIPSLTKDEFLKYFDPISVVAHITYYEKAAKVFHWFLLGKDEVLGNEIFVSMRNNASLSRRSRGIANVVHNMSKQDVPWSSTQGLVHHTPNPWATIPLSPNSLPSEMMSSCQGTPECYLFISQEDLSSSHCFESRYRPSRVWTCATQETCADSPSASRPYVTSLKKWFRVDVLPNTTTLHRRLDFTPCLDRDKPLVSFCGNPLSYLIDLDTESKRLFYIQPINDFCTESTQNTSYGMKDQDVMKSKYSFCLTFIDLTIYQDVSECLPLPVPQDLDLDVSTPPAYLHYDSFTRGLLVFYFDLTKSLILTVIDLNPLNQLKPRFSFRFSDFDSSWILFSAGRQAGKIALLGEKLFAEIGAYGVDLQTGHFLRLTPSRDREDHSF